MERREWCDAHAHLQDVRFAGRLDGVLFRARTAGVRLIHVNGTCEEDWGAVLAIGEREAVWVTVSLGMHPWRVAGAREGWERRLRPLVKERGYGVGEIGLDGSLKGDGAEGKRREAFSRQLDLAGEFGVPASVHGRGAWGEVIETILARPVHEGGILLHSYGGPADALEELAGRNVYVSFGGALTRSGGKKIPEAARRAVAGSVVLESDAPDQPPRLPDGCEPFLRDAEGRALSEPSGVALAGEALAELRGESLEETAATTTAAAMRLFGFSGGQSWM